MSINEIGLEEDVIPDSQDVPEVEVRGDEAVIRINLANTVEERRVKLPKTVWG